MQKLPDIIDLLLQKKANLSNDIEREKEEALKLIEQKYAEQADQLDELLIMAGYEEPPVEEVEELTETPVAEETTEQIDAEKAEVTYAQTVY